VVAGCQWLTPVILVTQEAEIMRIVVRSQPRQIVHKTLSQKKKTLHKKTGLVEWLKVKTLSSSPVPQKKKKKKTKVWLNFNKTKQN
jgi:hypothetical protein